MPKRGVSRWTAIRATYTHVPAEKQRHDVKGESPRAPLVPHIYIYIYVASSGADRFEVKARVKRSRHPERSMEGTRAARFFRYITSTSLFSTIYVFSYTFFLFLSFLRKNLLKLIDRSVNLFSRQSTRVISLGLIEKRLCFRSLVSFFV